MATASWSRFLARQAKAPPLLFVHGVRHAVRRGVCCPEHSHAAIEIVYHAVGRGITRLEGGGSASFSEGGAVIYAPHERHDQVMDSEGEDLCIQLALPPRLPGVPKHCLCVSPVEEPALIEDMRLLSRGHVHITPTEQTLFNLRATSTLLALIDWADKHPREETRSTPENYVLGAEQYIRDHFSSIQTMREIADHVGISHDHLRHVFQALRKKSMARYVNQIRVERAQTLLIHTRIPLKQIATMCGFKDPYYFSAVFQNFSGTPPGRYRGRNS